MAKYLPVGWYLFLGGAHTLYIKHLYPPRREELVYILKALNIPCEYRGAYLHIFQQDEEKVVAVLNAVYQ